MLKSKNRLKLKDAGTRSWRDKQEFFTPLFKVTYRFLNKTDPPTIAFVVYGKAGIAVKRNRVRRLLTSAVYERVEQFPNGLQAVFQVNKLYDKQAYNQISGLLDKFLSRLPKSTT